MSQIRNHGKVFVGGIKGIHVDECLDYEGTISSTRRICRILDAKYEKADLIQVMDDKCQHLTPNERERLLYV